MNRIRHLWAGWLLAGALAGNQSFAAETAVTMTLQGKSIRIRSIEQQRTDGMGVEQLVFSLIDPPTDYNDELTQLTTPTENGTHYTCYVQWRGTNEPPVVHDIQTYMPMQGDSNQNGVPDFLDPEIETPETLVEGGISTRPDGKPNPFKSTWKRAAGSLTGTVVVEIDQPLLKGKFSHTYELLRYSGVWNIQRTNDNLSGTVELGRDGFPGESLGGAVTVRRVSSDVIDFRAIAWKDSRQATFRLFLPFQLFRDRNTYSGPWSFTDGYPATAFKDYREWHAVIRDPRDANQNGVPDLSDSQTVLNPPKLTLKKISTGWELGIEGQGGSKARVESRASLAAGNPGWETLRELNLVEAVTRVELPPTADSSVFYRVSVE